MNRAHEQVIELMPWYLNGTLTDPERAMVEKHVRGCLPCRAAMREDERIRSLVQAQDDVPIGAGLGMADLFRRIDGRAGRSGTFRLRPQLGFGLAAVCVAIAGWFALTDPVPPESGTLARDAARAGSTDAPFTTLTDDSGSATNRIDIVLAEGITEDEVRDLIESLGARLIGGPSEFGRYTVAVQATTESELSDAITRFSADPRVRFAGRNYSAPPAADAQSR